MPKFKKHTLIFLLLFCALTLLSALPPAFTAKGNPKLYKELHSLALNNLKKLDRSHQSQYRRMLKNNNDVLMAYLLAYESDGALQVANPDDVMSNYLQVRTLLNTHGTSLEPEFYLSYVAHQTVTEERIEPYRDALLKDGLQEILDGSEDEMEIYRKLCQWCVGRLQFQPTSGRDQSPMDIVFKSQYGRCEEMQILFVAAARTVGLPARPASTPWWPHQDNNHAWAEVWLDGAWHYTGDMDAAYHPDQTWFSGMIDKTVLILANGSLPAENDEVLRSGRYDCTINSIRNYAGERTRNLKIQTLDAEGNPLADTSVGILVYNWGTLRPLIYVKTDSAGKYTLSVGRGAFYLSAFKDGKSALELVPSSEDEDLYCQLSLSEKPLADRDDMLFYPSNPFEWKQAPASWDEGVKVQKDYWAAIDRSYADRFGFGAAPKQERFIIAARGNHSQAQEFLRRHPNADENFLSDVVNAEKFDSKFLWQANADQIEALYFEWFKYNDEDEEEFWDFYYSDMLTIINPSVFYEELPQVINFHNSKPSIYPPAFYQKGKTALERLDKAAHWMKKNYKINAAKALDGLLPLDIAVRQKYLSPVQYRMMATNLARANAIPAGFSRRPNLLNVRFDDDYYGYYDLMKCAPEVDPEDKQAFCTLRVLTSDEDGAPLSLSYLMNLELIVFQDGAFYWPEGDPMQDEGNGIYTFRAPKGEYYLQAGYRVSDSQTAFQMRRVDLSEADSLQVEIVLREYPRGWSDGVYYELPELLDDLDIEGYSVFLIGNHDQENSVRLAEKLRSLGKKFLWVGHEPAAQSIANYVVSPTWKEWVKEDQRNRVRTITLVRWEDGKWIGSYEGLWDKLPE